MKIMFVIFMLLMLASPVSAQERPMDCLKADVKWLADYYRALRPTDYRYLISPELLAQMEALEGESIWDNANQRFDVLPGVYMLSFLWGYDEDLARIAVVFYATPADSDVLYMLVFNGMSDVHPCSAVAINSADILPALAHEVGLAHE